MKILSIEVFNLSGIGEFTGQPVPKGCLGVVVDQLKFDMYNELNGNIFYSECGGIVSVYKHVPGTKEGFAGRTIILPVMENSVISNKIKARRLKVFKGSLWKSFDAEMAVAKHLGTNIREIGIRQASDRYRVYCACMATEEFLKRISRVVVLGKPESSPTL
ncbi:hypothetical protein [Edwardsiella tarda]|uniref:hypothetical protein n=1 Tax=Edwardsiella tarda TaxID=636 RepID=UPI003081385B|nr:hypothetical protein GBS0709_24690 [Edwardsiella tarda]